MPCPPISNAAFPFGLCADRHAAVTESPSVVQRGKAMSLHEKVTPPLGKARRDRRYVTMILALETDFLDSAGLCRGIPFEAPYRSTGEADAGQRGIRRTGARFEPDVVCSSFQCLKHSFQRLLVRSATCSSVRSPAKSGWPAIRFSPVP